MRTKRFFLFLFFCFSPAIKTHAQLLDSLSLDTVYTYHSIEEGLKQPDMVFKLSLRKKKLKTFPMEILRFKNLQYLDLSKNQLEELPPKISELLYLQYLSLSRNKLITLPAAIGRLKNLKRLIVNQNDIGYLPKEIGESENLEYLDLWSNEISDLPEDIKNLKKLRLLDMRVILINNTQQKIIEELLPETKIYFSPSCNCGK